MHIKPLGFPMMRKAIVTAVLTIAAAAPNEQGMCLVCSCCNAPMNGQGKFNG